MAVMNPASASAVRTQEMESFIFKCKLMTVGVVLMLNSWAAGPAQASSSQTAPVAGGNGRATMVPADMFLTPEEACTHAGGHYLGEFKCKLANGNVVPILNSVDLLKEKESSTVIAKGTPRSWALATTAVIFESTGCRHDLLSGAIATPDRIKSQKASLKQRWNIGSRDDLMDMLYWLQYSGHRKEFEDLGHRVDALSNE